MPKKISLSLSLSFLWTTSFVSCLPTLSQTLIMIVQEDEYKELVIIAHTMEDNYGHFFDSVIPFEDVDFVLKQVMYEIR